MSQHDTIIHLVAGGIAGTAGAVVTCPLEVVKTRLQSSNPVFGNEPMNNGGIVNQYHRSKTLPNLGPPKFDSSGKFGRQTPGSFGPKNGPTKSPFSTCASCGRSAQILAVPHHHSNPVPTAATPKIGLVQCLRLIIEKEGPRALFKGLGPNLVGVAPSRAIYFCAYSQSKKTYNEMFPTESPVVHICSAATAGFVACTATNPVWFVKTRLQLDQQRGLSTRETIKRIYAKGGILGFYKGISASYMGISETVIHFVIYENVKKRLQEWNNSSRTLADEDYSTDDKTSKDFLQFMAAGAFSKTVASCIAYPHEVARTRLREEGNKYRHLIQTLTLVAKEEGHRGLYRGLATQLIRQIPNTAIMMSTYEASVYLLTKYFPRIEEIEYSSSETNMMNIINRSEEYDDSYFVDTDSPSQEHILGR